MKNINCTIVIPTYNRPSYIERTLSFLSNYGCVEKDIKIIIGDSSYNEIKSINKNIIKSFKKDLDILYIDNLTSDLDIYTKSYLLHKMVKTKYSVLYADDDFTFPYIIRKSVKFLDEHDDYGCTLGRFIRFKEEDNIIHWHEIYKRVIYNQLNPVNRFYKNFSNFTQTMYGVHRSDLLNMYLENVIDNTIQDRFAFDMVSSLDFIYGKVKRFNTIFGMREKANTKERNRKIKENPDKEIREIINGDSVYELSYKERYEMFRKCIMNHLIKYSTKEEEYLKRKVDRAVTNANKGNSIVNYPDSLFSYNDFKRINIGLRYVSNDKPIIEYNWKNGYIVGDNHKKYSRKLLRELNE